MAEPFDKRVHVTVSGLTGTGKSAVYGEIQIALQAIGLTVEHADPSAARYELGMSAGTGGWDDVLSELKPTVVLHEVNIARGQANV